jgi:hypothetical protein
MKFTSQRESKSGFGKSGKSIQRSKLSGVWKPKEILKEK